MIKNNFVFNLCLFMSAMCLIVSLFIKSFLLISVGLICGVIALKIYRVKYPKKIQNIAELLHEKSTQKTK